MPGHLLYSTNPYFAYEVARTYLCDRQTVWACDSFDTGSAFSNARVSMVGPSASPRAIAERLLLDVRLEDQHSWLIRRYRVRFLRLADEWRRQQVISEEHATEIKALAQQPTFRKWRPLIYLIPRAAMADSGRLGLVPPERRAAHGAEYEIRDLDLSECDIIEWGPD